MKTISKMAAGVIAVALAATPVAAQEKARAPSAEEIQRQMLGPLEGMVPLMGKMVQAMIEAQLVVLERPETAQRMARYVRNLRDALVREGFTPQEALQIATTMPIPNAGMAPK